MNVEQLPIESITPYARNPRRNAQAVDKVAASLREFSWRQPIVVDETNTIIVGHTRYLAARKLGMATIPVHVARGLTPAQIKAYRLMDNRSHEDSGWDEELLTLEIEDLKGLDYDLSLTGFEIEELGDYLGQAVQDTEDMEADFIPAPPAEPVTRLGDVWLLGAHRIVCGDVRNPQTWSTVLARNSETPDNGERAIFKETPEVVERVQMCITSPPYWGLRDYGTAEWEGGEAGCDHFASSGNRNKGRDLAASGGRFHDFPVIEEGAALPYRDTCGKCGARRIDAQLGLEATPEEWTANLVEVFRRVREVLPKDGTLWVNVGDSYATSNPGSGGDTQFAKKKRGEGMFFSNPRKLDHGLKPKDLVGQPWRLAFALQADGWWLRQDIIWAKPNPMPESVTDRCTKAHEYLFLLAKGERYYWDQDAIREPVAREWDPQTNNPGWLRGESKGQAPDYHPGEKRSGSDFVGFRNGPNPVGRNRRSVWQIATEPFSANALFDGTSRIKSANCPVHGDRAAQVATVEHGEHEASSMSVSARNSDNDSHPAPMPLNDCVPTRQRHELGIVPDSSDSPDLPYSVSAKPHNSGSHKTAPAYATTAPYTPYVGTGENTERTSKVYGSAVIHPDTHENNISPDASAARLPGQTPHRTAGKSCSCGILDHFATYPCKLVEPCILAGTSVRGHCPACGRGWGRVSETQFIASPHKGGPMGKRGALGDKRADGEGMLDLSKYSHKDKHVTTTGWRPGCECATEVYDTHLQQALVLDPFLGAGTTMIVAEQLGRACRGIELNPAYVDIAIRRYIKLFGVVDVTLEGDGRTFDAVAEERVRAVA